MTDPLLLTSPDSSRVTTSLSDFCLHPCQALLWESACASGHHQLPRRAQVDLKPMGRPITCANEREKEAEPLSPMCPLFLTLPISSPFLFHCFPVPHPHPYPLLLLAYASLEACLERRAACERPVSSKSPCFEVCCHIYTCKTSSDSRGWKTI